MAYHGVNDAVSGSPIGGVSNVCTRDQYGNSGFNNVFADVTGHAAFGTITLTASSSGVHTFSSGSGSATVVLPNATTLVNGWQFFFNNNASGNITVEAYGGGLITTMVPGSALNLYLQNNSFPAGQWYYHWTMPQTAQYGTAGLTVTGEITATSTLAAGVTSSTTGSLLLYGATSGTVTIKPQAAAGTYNFNLPTTAGTTGQVLTSAGGGASAMTWSSPGGITLTGDSGSATGNSLTLYAHQSANNCGKTVLFSNTGTTSTLNVSDTGGNTIIGAFAAGSATLNSNTYNTMLGYQAGSLATSAQYLINIGYQAGFSNQSANGALAIGYKCLYNSQNTNFGIGNQTLMSVSTGGGNTVAGNESCTAGNFSTTTCFGSGCLGALSSGNGNCCLGNGCFPDLATGSANLGLGNEVGQNYLTSESSNILLNSNGVTGDNNTLRIGAATGSSTGDLNKAFICGIQGISVTGAAVLVSSGDQLGVTVSSRKYKDNIVDMNSYSSRMLDLRPVTFTMKGDTQVVPGLIAEEVAEVMPDLVVYDQLGDPQTVKYHELPSMLLNELQKALARIEALEAKFA